MARTEELEGFVPCGCGCGILMDPLGRKGQPRRFLYRHSLSPAVGVAWSRLSGPDDPSDPGCWEWQAYRNEHGYGTTRRHGENYAHRAAWVHVNGPIPEGMWVLHRCDNPPCIRPSHLFLGDVVANTDDMVSKDRQFKGRPVDTTALVGRYRSGASLEQVMCEFEISHRRTRRILADAGVTIRLRRDQAACSKGHEYTAENTYRDKLGKRQCKRCNAERAQRRRDAARAA